MSLKIYGVDTTKEITPIMVRDAVVKCFTSAHKEVLNQMDEFHSWESKKEREEFRKLEIELVIKDVFRQVGGDFSDPSKEDLLKVLDELADLATKFRSPEIVKKHYEEIMGLVKKLK